MLNAAPFWSLYHPNPNTGTFHSVFGHSASDDVLLIEGTGAEYAMTILLDSHDLDQFDKVDDGKLKTFRVALNEAKNPFSALESHFEVKCSHITKAG